MLQKIKILTDSGCDLPKEMIKEYGINVLPFEITLGGKSFREIFDKSTEEFYEMLSMTDEIPKHSQISPTRFTEAYEQLYSRGATDIIRSLKPLRRFVKALRLRTLLHFLKNGSVCVRCTLCLSALNMQDVPEEFLPQKRLRVNFSV